MTESPKPLYDTRALRPILTAMDRMGPGYDYRRPQGLDHHLIVLTVGGQAVMGPVVGRFPQSAGDLVVIEPHRAIYQQVALDKRWSRVWAIFDPQPQWDLWSRWPQLAPGYWAIRLPSVRRGTPVRHFLETVHYHAAGTLRHGRALAMNALEAALLWCNENNPHGDQWQADPRVMRASEFINRHLHHRLTLDDIADAAGLSVPHLTRLFRAQLKTSPITYLEHARMQYACTLLRTTARGIADIARAVGFEDALYFSTRFKRFARVSPRTYRNENPPPQISQRVPDR
jgi:AraC family transcriptional regulator of arabinose operon